ncbi:MAG: nitronate monooxygenase [Fulvivirga sp.]|uniref:NAD(P)H-dependent flavin oxidoreductase n=1 Tax=Fulvivirga sp. TaxID=1931237 RepID=UPI0032EE2221
MNKITQLFDIKYPIIQAGMVWCSGWKLASAVSNAGGLGLIGAGSMHPETLREHIAKCKKATDRPFGVNVPLLYPEIEKIMSIIIEEGVDIVFTSAGNPKTWTTPLKENGIKVVHVVSSVKFALKAQDAEVDAIVAEGFEAGGHNGREEITTFCLIPAVKEAIDIPLLAAGGIGTGRGMLGAMALGADGVQIGSRFAASTESSAHHLFKERVVSSIEGDTILTLKKLAPVRLIKNHFYDLVKEAEERGAGIDELRALLGKRRSKLGIFEGDLKEGELEIGQISAYINNIKGAAEILSEIWEDYQRLKSEMCQ